QNPSPRPNPPRKKLIEFFLLFIGEEWLDFLLFFAPHFSARAPGKCKVGPLPPGRTCIDQQIPRVLFPGKRFAESSRRLLSQERRKRLC
ncbi:hypothetical protein QUG62_23980, partial [Klebsiella michiganensis]|uniref:hypothetical protein n=1 Tax=Klebsiella michiganensis TaxID=1134687 RepID=UPI0025A2EF71